MLFVDNREITDPRVNLALEEHLLRHLATDQELLLFYINEPSIIIGRNQNAVEEINCEYVNAHGVHVVRRLSGGGAVYHDLGNLNFSFIAPNHPENVLNFKKFNGPVIRVLNDLGVPAELGARNDILAGGRKISGNAQFVAGKRMYSHGTLLLNSDLSRVNEALNVKPAKYESKGVKSVRSRVANISEFLSAPLSMSEFTQALLRGIFGEGDIPEYPLSEEDWQAIEKLADERYRRWEWNFGHSPDFNVERTHRFVLGRVEARFDVHEGLIRGAKLCGDFFGREDVAELESELIGTRYERASVERLLSGVDLSRYISGMTSQDFLELFC